MGQEEAFAARRLSGREGWFAEFHTARLTWPVRSTEELFICSSERIVTCTDGVRRQLANSGGQIFCRNSARCHAQPSPPRAYERGKKGACGPVAGDKANARSLQSRDEAQGLRRAALAVEVGSVALAEHRRGPRRLRHRRPAVRRQHSRGGGEARYNRRQRTQTGTCQAGRAPGLAARLSGFVVSVALLSPAIAAAQEWPTYGGDPGGRRFSNATQITPDNVARLMPA